MPSCTATASARLGGLVVLAVIAWSLAGPAAGAPAGERRAPRFRVETLDRATFELDLARRKGPVLLDFWATWCRPCLEALPEIEDLYLEYRAAGFTVLGISIDGPRNFPKVRPFARRLGLSYPIALDEDGELQRLYQVAAVPTSVLVDTAGRIVRIQQGYRPGEIAELEAVLKGLLPSATPASGTPAAPDQAVADSARSPQPGH